jgi:hypothetical protein
VHILCVCVGDPPSYLAFLVARPELDQRAKPTLRFCTYLKKQSKCSTARSQQLFISSPTDTNSRKPLLIRRDKFMSNIAWPSLKNSRPKIGRPGSPRVTYATYWVEPTRVKHFINDINNPENNQCFYNQVRSRPITTLEIEVGIIQKNSYDFPQKHVSCILIGSNLPKVQKVTRPNLYNFLLLYYNN